MLSPEHTSLNRESAIAAELIASGVTLLGRATYASSGIYGQAFFNLSIGFERAAKLIYIADHAIEHQGKFPSNDILKNSIGHDLSKLFDHAALVSERRRKGQDYWLRPSTEIHNGIVETLAEFARKTRYYNLDTVTDGKSPRDQANDPMVAWDRRVITPIMQKHCGAALRAKIEKNARAVDEIMGSSAMVRFTTEGGEALDTVYAASKRTGETDFARRWAPLYVLQLARWLSLLLDDLSTDGAYKHRILPLLGLDEHFVIFNNDDSYFKSRRTWSIYKS